MRRVTSASYHRGALDEHPLRIRFLRYTMEGEGMEYGFLSSLDGISVEGPWPDDDKLTQTEAVDSLVAAPINPRLNLCEAGESDPPAAIVHFACHCLTDKADEGDWEIWLGRPARKVAVRLFDLRKGFIKSATSSSVRPLVFMNACGTSVINTETAGSFQRWVLNNGH